MQILTIVGNLTRDPDSRDVNGKTVCNFTVAVNRQKKPDGTQEADFFRVAAWGKMGENCQKYLTKGRKVGVTGTVSVRAYADQSGQPKASMEVFAKEVEFLSSAGGGNSAEHTAPAQAPATDTNTGGFMAVETDELPF